MLSNNENENIFSFGKNDISNLQNFSITQNKAITSPTISPFIKELNEKYKKTKTGKKYSKIIFTKLTVIIILIIYLILYFNFDDIQPYRIKQDQYYQAILNEIKDSNDEIFKFSEMGITKTFLTQKIIGKFNSYIDLCFNNQLKDMNTYPLKLNPKISIIMPLYKGGAFLYYSLRSIQNQKMKDIEIILIDDNSPDDTLLIIDKYMKEDPRIKLIKNNINRKVLYSKSIGALNAKGKYILQLDQDDMFIRDDVFDILYSEAELNNLDLVQIRDITKNNFHFNKKSIVNVQGKHYIYPKNNQYKEQPNLKDSLFINNNVFLLWGLLIKTDLYKQAIYKLWKIIINYQIIFHEDYTLTFLIVILAKNYKYLNKYALIHYNHKDSASNYHWKIKEYYLSILFFANNLYDYYIKDNLNDIKLGINFIKLAESSFKKGKELYPNMYKLFFKKISKKNYLSKNEQEYLEKEFKINFNYSSILSNDEYLSIEYFQNLKNVNKTHNINNTTYNISQNVYISIIIVCNEYKYLQNTIISIENQQFENYEIIIIYDNNDKNNLDLIQKLIILNNNIKLIINEKVKGYLYSISRGILYAKGKYILALEPGYTLATNNTLNELYIEINNTKSDIDILEFNLLINYNEIHIISKNSLNLYKCEHFKSKTKKELNKLKYNKNIRDIDLQKELLFNKLIKADIYKKLINEYKLNEYNDIIYNYYDDIVIFMLLKNNIIKFKHIDNYGVIQNLNSISNLNKYQIINNNTQKITDSIFYINFLYENSNNRQEDKESVLIEFFNVLSIIFNKFSTISGKAQELYEKFLNCNYISLSYKTSLKIYYSSLVN